jgi:hypothetical protein
MIAQLRSTYPLEWHARLREPPSPRSVFARLSAFVNSRAMQIAKIKPDHRGLTVVGRFGQAPTSGGLTIGSRVRLRQTRRACSRRHAVPTEKTRILAGSPVHRCPLTPKSGVGAFLRARSVRINPQSGRRQIPMRGRRPAPRFGVRSLSPIGKGDRRPPKTWEQRTSIIESEESSWR